MGDVVVAGGGARYGAALTERAVIGEAWRRCWLAASLPYATTSNEVDQLLAATVALPAGGSLVVLVDSAIGTTASVETLRAAGSIVLLLAPTTVSPPLRSTLRAGVDGLVTLGDSVATLGGAIRPLITGAAYASPCAARLLLDEHRDRPRARPEALDVVLSRQERAVLQAMVDGLTTKATARRLGIANKTVEAHRSRLFARLHVRSQSEAITRALTDGRLLDPAGQPE